MFCFTVVFSWKEVGVGRVNDETYGNDNNQDYDKREKNDIKIGM